MGRLTATGTTPTASQHDRQPAGRRQAHGLADKLPGPPTRPGTRTCTAWRWARRTWSSLRRSAAGSGRLWLRRKRRRPRRRRVARDRGGGRPDGNERRRVRLALRPVCQRAHGRRHARVRVQQRRGLPGVGADLRAPALQRRAGLGDGQVLPGRAGDRAVRLPRRDVLLPLGWLAPRTGQRRGREQLGGPAVRVRGHGERAPAAVAAVPPQVQRLGRRAAVRQGARGRGAQVARRVHGAPTRRCR